MVEGAPQAVLRDWVKFSLSCTATFVFGPTPPQKYVRACTLRENLAADNDAMARANLQKMCEVIRFRDQRVVAHGAILRIYEKKPLVADQVAINYRKADITPRQRAMLDFAMKVCLQSHTVEDNDFTALHAHGFDDEDIWDIAGITAFFGLSNRMANVTGMLPNSEFYLLGRVPKAK